MMIKVSLQSRKPLKSLHIKSSGLIYSSFDYRSTPTKFIMIVPIDVLQIITGVVLISLLASSIYMILTILNMALIFTNDPYKFSELYYSL